MRTSTLLLLLALPLLAFIPPACTWTLLPGTLQISIAGELSKGSLQQRGRIRTTPSPNTGVLENGDLELTTAGTAGDAVTFTHATLMHDRDGRYRLKGDLMMHGTAEPVELEATVEMVQDVNQQELLHLRAWGKVVRYGAATLSGPYQELASTMVDVSIDAWFIRADPRPTFVPFCSSDD